MVASDNSSDVSYLGYFPDQVYHHYLIMLPIPVCMSASLSLIIPELRTHGSRKAR